MHGGTSRASRSLTVAPSRQRPGVHVQVSPPNARLTGGPGEHAVWHQTVEVNVEPDRGIESLIEDDGSRLRVVQFASARHSEVGVVSQAGM